MDVGLIGLGRMGANMAQRWVRGGQRVIGFDSSPDARRTIEIFGAATADSLEALVRTLPPPRAVWLMVPEIGRAHV